MLEIRNLTKRYGSVVANKNISLTVPARSVTLQWAPMALAKAHYLKALWDCCAMKVKS